MARGVASMTRSAMVNRAIELFAEDPQMSASEVARRLGVGRTTLYRHFPGREDLLLAVGQEGARRIVGAYRDMTRDESSGLLMLERLAEHLFGLGPVLTLVISNDPVVGAGELAAASRELSPGGGPENPVHRAVDRGRADGTIDPGLPAEWIETFLWTTLTAGQLYTEQTGARHEALELVLQALRRGTAAG